MLTFQSRPANPRPNYNLVRDLRVRSLYAPTMQNFTRNLVGTGLLEGTSGGVSRIGYGPGGLGLENDGASDFTHLASRYDAGLAFNSPLLIGNNHTIFGVVSHRSFGTHRSVLSIGNSDSRFEMRFECDSSSGFAYSYWDNYVIGQRYSVGTPPELNVPIAFVATLSGTTTGSPIAAYMSDGSSVQTTLSASIFPSTNGHCDAFTRGDGHMYMWGHADGVWSRNTIQDFLGNPYRLIKREVDAPIVVAAATPDYPIWKLKNRLHTPKHLSMLRR